MEPYITVAVNAGQALATESANYVAREKQRALMQTLAIVAGALLLGIVLKRSK